MTVWSRIAASRGRNSHQRARPRSVGRQRPDRQNARRRRAGGRSLVPDAPVGRGKAEPATVLIRTPYGRTVMGPLGRSREPRVTRSSSELPGDIRVRWELVPVRNEQADGPRQLEWVVAQPWFDGRLVMWGGSYLGMTQWAVAQDAPDFVRALSLQVTAANFRDSVVFPGVLRARDGAGLAARDQAPGARGRTVLRTHLRGARVVSTASAVLPLGKCDSAAIGEPMAFYQDWLEHSAPGDPWWDEVDFGRRLEKVPPSSFIGGWYDLFLKAQVDDYEKLRRAGRTARLTIGPWTHASPGLFAEPCATGLDGSTASSAGPGERRTRRCASSSWGRAPGREFSLWPPAGETERVVSRTGRDADPDAPGRAPPATPRSASARPVPLQPARPHAGRRRAVASTWPRRGARTTSPRGPPRRADLHQPCAHRGPHRHRPAHGASLFVRSSLERTDFFVRLCDVDRKG